MGDGARFCILMKCSNQKGVIVSVGVGLPNPSGEATSPLRIPQYERQISLAFEGAAR